MNKADKVGNANYLWISYFHSDLSPTGRAGFVMSSQASSAGHGEAEVRRKLVQTGDVDVMVAIRPNFFYTRTVPCELWFLTDIKYREIVAAYNLDKDRATIEEVFARLMALSKNMDDEQHRAAREGLKESELAIFDLMQKTNLAATERERIKQSSRELLAELLRIIAPLDQWTEKEQTRAEVETVILDQVFMLPEPPYTPDDKDAMAKMLYAHVWQQSRGGRFGSEAPDGQRA